MNDGTAFPFIMLGLGLLGLHDLGTWGWRWWTVDVLWAITAGVAIGAIGGRLVGKLAVHLRRRQPAGPGLDDYLSLGVLAGVYGLAILVDAYGFLAAFAAGLALRRVGTASDARVPVSTAPIGALARDGAPPLEPEHVPAHMARAVLGFNEQLERICEAGAVLLIGGTIAIATLPLDALWFVPAVLLVIRPLSVLVGLARAPLGRSQHLLVSWFGIRGIGSVYYLMFAITHGVPAAEATRLIGLTMSVIATSIVVHGITATPLMHVYGRRGRSGRGGEP